MHYRMLEAGGEGPARKTLLRPKPCKAPHPLQPIVSRRRVHQPVAGPAAYPSERPKDGISQPRVCCKRCQAGRPALTSQPSSAQWIARPADETCAGCHSLQRRGLEQGLHGMRLALGLPAMRLQFLYPAVGAWTRPAALSSRAVVH